MASLPAPPNQIETLIEEKRSLDVIEKPTYRLWEDSGDYTHFLIAWNARPPSFSITEVFAGELRRRKGLRAYGVRVSPRRVSKVNQALKGISPLTPRLLVVAKPEAA